MKKFLLTLLLIVFGLVASSAVYAQEKKFAYVDIVSVFNKYKKTDQYEKKLEEEAKAKKKEQEKSVEEVKKLQDKLAIVSKEEKEKTQKEWEEKMKQLQQSASQAETELRNEFLGMREEIIKEIKKAVKDYAEKNNITFVFQDLALAYIDPSLDITDEIIKILNEQK